MKTDVIVVGSGPAGSAVAAHLAGAGARVVLLEAAAHPRPKACAEYASPRITEELARIGLLPAAWAHTAVALDGMQLHAGGRSVRIGYADRHRQRNAWGVDRSTFDACLAQHAATRGAELRERTRAVDVLRDRHRVTGARIRTPAGEETIRADWVIGADGARSTIARRLGVEAAVRMPRRLGLVARYEPLDDLVDHGEMHVGPRGYVGLAPVPGMLNVGMALPLNGGGSAAERFDAAIAAIPAIAARLAGARRTTPIRGAAPIGHRVRDVAGPGWLLVGDAAGFVDPFTGEGIHRALRGARAAADAILRSEDVPAAYREARRRAFAAKQALSWIVQGVLAVPGLMGHAVGRLDERPATALRLGSALGDCRPATEALSPRAVWEVLAP